MVGGLAHQHDRSVAEVVIWANWPWLVLAGKVWMTEDRWETTPDFNAPGQVTHHLHLNFRLSCLPWSMTQHPRTNYANYAPC
jgi:hypothetical protein